MSPSDDAALRLPYPGLRSFQRDESDLFFGREGTVNEMINRLRPNHFLAVLGTSGSGKSSLVRIGLLDGLELGLLADAGSRWRIADFAPGANPMRNLARELVRLSGGSEIDVDFVEAFLRRGPRSLIEWCQDGHLPAGANLLLLVDQFEELFRYQDYAERQAAEAFVALLIESARTREVPIYVVMTMRSEYLGACALIEGLAEIINDGQFLTPRLNRDECREAIVGPAAVCDTIVEPDLVNRLLNDLEDFAPWDDRDSGDQLDRLVRRADQLPLLQHTLNRLWLRADAHRRDKNEPILLTLADYDEIGGLRGAINAHADEILATLTPEQQKRAEQVFRALTDGKSIATAVRRPTRLDELVAVADGDEAGVRAVVDAFRETGVNFLRPDTSQPLRPDTIVDISHESLIRQWRKLSGWLMAEAREAQEWTRLGEAAARYRSGEGSLYYGQDLHAWREHSRPTAAWAKRYNQPYEETLAFLDESTRTDRRGRRVRNAAIAAAFIVVVGFGIIGSLVWSLFSQRTTLIALNEDLATQTEALSAATTELEANNAALIAAQDRLILAQEELADSVDRLQAARDELRNVFLGSFDASVAAYQNAGRWTEAGALLGAMLRQTAHGVGAERQYDDGIVDAARMRLAGQWALPVWSAVAVAEPLPVAAGGIRGANRYAVTVGGAARTEVALVDRLTGAVLAEAVLPEPPAAARHFVAAGGEDVVIVGDTGNIIRWHTPLGAIASYGSIGEPGRYVRDATYDPVTDRVAVALYEEDSVVSVLASGEGEVFRALLATIDGIDEVELESRGGTIDATGIAFWRDALVVGFRPTAGVEQFAVIDMAEREATVLPLSVTQVMPSSDGQVLLVVDGDGCAAAGDLLPINPDGLAVGIDPAVACLGVLHPGAAEPVAIGALRPESADGAGMALISAEAVGDADGATTYRVVVDDGSAEAPRPVAFDLAGDRGVLMPVSGTEGGVAGMITLEGAAGPVFADAFIVDPWQPAPDPAMLKAVAWFDPASERSIRLADIVGIGDRLALRLVGGPDRWPADKLGPVDGAAVAAGADWLIAVSGRQAGIQPLATGTGDLTLRDVTFGRGCRFAADEPIDLLRLVPWSDSAPAFLGLDLAGRVLRFAPSSGGAAQGVQVSCIGSVRADSDAILLAEPSRARAFLQTDPQSFAILSAEVETERDFNESQKVSFAVAARLATLVSGEAAQLASVDRNGNLTVLREDQGWQPVDATRTVVVSAPVDLASDGEKLLVVGESGAAVVVDLAADGLPPVTAGRVPLSAPGYSLNADGNVVAATVGGAIWRIALPTLPQPGHLAQFAEAAAGALTDSSDQDQVTLGERLIRGEDEPSDGDIAEMALGADARCYLAANAVLEAWKSEAGQGAPGPRLAAAREEAEAQCIGPGPLAVVGRRLAQASHFVSPAIDPWPAEWSGLVRDALAGNRLAARAVLIGLTNSADAFASAAGEWLANSDAALGLEISDDLLEDVAAGAAIDPALQRVVKQQRESYEPAIHELLGHIAVRGGDAARLSEGWVHFRIAELIYRSQIGRGAEADRTAELRAALARALPADLLLDAWREAGAWTANIGTLPVGSATAADTTDARLLADAGHLASLGSEGDPYLLLQAYLWLNLAELQMLDAPVDAAVSYGRVADIVLSLPDVGELTPSMGAALADAAERVAELAAEGRLGGPGTAAFFAPFVFRLAEPEVEGNWDVASLRAYAATIETVTSLLSADPDEVSDATLDRIVFAPRRFGHGFHVDNDQTREAGEAALNARLALIALLIDRDRMDRRWDLWAAKAATEFWIGYRLHDADTETRAEWLTAAVTSGEQARDLAGADFPPEARYWLTEARRWMPTEDAGRFLGAALGGLDDYARLEQALDAGAWEAPLDRGELFGSHAELAAKIADAHARLLFDRADDWSPDDPAIRESALDALYYLAAWDRVRRAAIEAGSTWSSTDPGYSYAPGYLLGTLGGRLQLMAGVEATDGCDRLASFGADPARRAPAVAYANLDTDAALEACRPLWMTSGGSPRLAFLMGRLLWDTADRNSLGLDLTHEAATADYAAAFDGLAGYLESWPGNAAPNANAMHLDLRAAFAQRVTRQVFADVYAWLAPAAATENHREGLRWLASRAAALGSPEAHLVLAEQPGLPTEEWAYHTEVAAKLFEAINSEMAEALRATIPPQYYVDAADRAEDEYRMERLIPVPAGLIDAVRASN